MTDELRMMLMDAVTVSMALLTAFGLDLTKEQSVALVVAATIIVNMAAYFWPKGQGDRAV